MNDLQVTASCTAASGDGASLDGTVTISLDGTSASYTGLADGSAAFPVDGVDASFLVTADVTCDGATPGVTYEVVGVAVAPMPMPTPELFSETAAYESFALPATGVDGGALSGLALAAVVIGASLVRLARRVPA